MNCQAIRLHMQALNQNEMQYELQHAIVENEIASRFDLMLACAIVWLGNSCYFSD